MGAGAGRAGGVRHVRRSAAGARAPWQPRAAFAACAAAAAALVGAAVAAALPAAAVGAAAPRWAAPLAGVGRRPLSASPSAAVGGRRRGLRCGPRHGGDGRAATAARRRRRRRQDAAKDDKDNTIQLRELAEGDTVVVIGASGNVGKVAAQRLLGESFRVRAVVRSEASGERLRQFLGPGRAGEVEIVEASAAQAPQGLPAVFRGAAAALVCTGVSALPTGLWAGGGVAPDDVPSRFWEALSGNGFDVRRAVDELTAAGLNTPDAVNNRGLSAIARAAGEAAEAGTFKRLVLLSSIGVSEERRRGFPFSILNVAGVLDSFAAGEASIRAAAAQSGFSYTISAVQMWGAGWRAIWAPPSSSTSTPPPKRWSFRGGIRPRGTRSGRRSRRSSSRLSRAPRPTTPTSG
ncbi:unnamed protein product [Prorocentrum cordatum]|uniref:NAD(P)-binding domain-containing protein n=1 Tax=Prorocentrum cordatum TaxID=2364126 RepID=A0ABN9U853_9DINO|nr:unnamed protein product [Polarella glacialis]